MARVGAEVSPDPVVVTNSRFESEVVLQACRERGIRPDTVTRINEGGDHHTFLINEQLILRMSDDPLVVAKHRQEVAVRTQLREHTVIPVADILGYGVTGNGWSYVLERRMDGSSVETRDLSLWGREQLAGALRQLYALPLVAGLSLLPDADVVVLRQRCLEATAVCIDLGVTADDVFSLRYPERDDTDRIIHADLKGEHILVNIQGDLTGIIDWTDVATGDVSWDCSGLSIAVGASTATSILEQAGVSAAAIQRGMTLARLASLIAVAESRQGMSDAPPDLLMKQFRRAWEAP